MVDWITAIWNKMGVETPFFKNVSLQIKSILINFHPLEFESRGSEAQFQLGAKFILCNAWVIAWYYLNIGLLLHPVTQQAQCFDPMVINCMSPVYDILKKEESQWSCLFFLTAVTSHTETLTSERAITLFSQS